MELTTTVYNRRYLHKHEAPSMYVLYGFEIFNGIQNVHYNIYVIRLDLSLYIDS